MESTIAFYDIVGMVGVGCILAMYLAVQTAQVRAESLVFSLVNLVGALLILYSLIYEFNLSAVIIEISWCIISVVGLIRYARSKRGGG